MKLCKLSMNDFISYMIDQNHMPSGQTDIIGVIADYYHLMTNKYITVLFPYQTLCFTRYQKITENTMLIPGMLVSRPHGTSRMYGVVMQNASKEVRGLKTKEFGVFYIDKNETVCLEPFSANHWTYCGIMSELFHYEGMFDDQFNFYLGERELRAGMHGKDVLMLQQLLQYSDPELKVTGIFDGPTEEALRQIQKVFHLEETGTFSAGSSDIIEILTGLYWGEADE